MLCLSRGGMWLFTRWPGLTAQVLTGHNLNRLHFACFVVMQEMLHSGRPASANAWSSVLSFVGYYTIDNKTHMYP